MTDPIAEVLVTILMAFIIVLVVLYLVNPSRSKKYRELLTDLYVSGKIRQFADEDKVDLDVEKLNFERYSKNQLLTDKGLSKVIEEDLKEKVIEKTLKKVTLNKVDKKK